MYHVPRGRSKSVLISGCKLANELMKLEDERKWVIMSKVWVELLSYAASHCSASGDLWFGVWFSGWLLSWRSPFVLNGEEFFAAFGVQLSSPTGPDSSSFFGLLDVWRLGASVHRRSSALVAAVGAGMWLFGSTIGGWVCGVGWGSVWSVSKGFKGRRRRDWGVAAVDLV
ncbi:hypothetical protein RHGRI_004483 [Rhododendron griersonianum]|uniref:Uncharacterized protein n=1 Tax=Rhododendron griersonianum TaxID=479676 RepID=A0AAV6L9L6_9ERIC|nr:hypothetical protein RHGRI_004483 [Rhododendron griersonianum]